MEMGYANMRGSASSIRLRLLLALCLASCLGGLAWAYVNPNFTPKHIEKQASLLCTCRVTSLAADGKSAEFTVLEGIKGRPP